MERIQEHLKMNMRELLTRDVSLHHRYSVRDLLFDDGAAILYNGFDYVAEQPVTILEFFPSAIAFRENGVLTVSPMNRESGELYFIGMEAFYRQHDKLMQAIGSPNIQSIFDVFYENGTAYAIAEQWEGLTLAQYMFLHKCALSGGELTYIIRALSDALLVVHSCDLLHCGITPESILLCPDGTVKLVRFSAGKASVESGHALRNGSPADDLYALGKALYRAHTGKIFANANPFDSVDQDFAPLFTGLLSDSAALRFSSVFDLRYTVECLTVLPERPAVTLQSMKQYDSAVSCVPVPIIPPYADPHPEAVVQRKTFPWVLLAVGTVLLLLLGLLVWVLIAW